MQNVETQMENPLISIINIYTHTHTHIYISKNWNTKSSITRTKKQLFTTIDS